MPCRQRRIVAGSVSAAITRIRLSQSGQTLTSRRNTRASSFAPRYIACVEALNEAGENHHLGHLLMLGHTDRLLEELDADPGRVQQEITLGHLQEDRGTPLDQAAISSNSDQARMLMDRDARADAIDSCGGTRSRWRLKKSAATNPIATA